MRNTDPTVAPIGTVWLPAVVIRDGAEVRAARNALDKENTNG